MMKRSLSLLVAVVLGGNMLFAQSVDQGKKFLYYERYKSAQETLEKVVSANPNNIEAVYWLGQTLLEQKDSIGAKNLYQKLLQQNGNAPLVMAGIGEVELMEGKVNDARQRFETAITLTKGKDIDVLNAVARANVHARPGDANYAIEKLNQATQVKGFKDPETYMVMGDAYRKLVDGGNAVTSYNKAFQLDPKLAEAKFKIGRVYATQGNAEAFLPMYEEATQIDPAYTPAYYDLFYYWYSRDVNKAAVYLDKYAANADQGPNMEYLKTDFAYSKGDDFPGAIAKAKQLIQQYGDKVNPRMYRLIAYASDKIKDYPAAKDAMNTFLAKAAPEEILPGDYTLLANVAAQVPGNEQEAFANYEKAIAKDTLVENKVKLINEAAALAKKLNDRKQEAKWLGIAVGLKESPSQTDLYNWGTAWYQAGEYKTADSIFCGIYQSKFPDQIYGYLWCARSKRAQDDTANFQGVATDAFKLLAEKATQLDSVKYKAQIIESYFYLITVSNDVKKDKAAALDYTNKILALDPTNATALRIKEILEKANRPAAQPARPRTGSNAAGNSGSSAKSPAKK